MTSIPTTFTLSPELAAVLWPAIGLPDLNGTRTIDSNLAARLAGIIDRVALPEETFSQYIEELNGLTIWCNSQRFSDTAPKIPGIGPQAPVPAAAQSFVPQPLFTELSADYLYYLADTQPNYPGLFVHNGVPYLLMQDDKWYDLIKPDNGQLKYAGFFKDTEDGIAHVVNAGRPIEVQQKFREKNDKLTILANQIIGKNVDVKAFRELMKSITFTNFGAAGSMTVLIDGFKVKTENADTFSYAEVLNIGVAISSEWFDSLSETDPNVIFIDNTKTVVFRRWKPDGNFESIFLVKNNSGKLSFVDVPDENKQNLANVVSLILADGRSNIRKRLDSIINNDPANQIPVYTFNGYARHEFVTGVARVGGFDYRIDGNQIYSTNPSYLHSEKIPFSLADYTIRAGKEPAKSTTAPAWYAALPDTSVHPLPATSQLQLVWRLQLNRDNINSTPDKIIYLSRFEHIQDIFYAFVTERGRQKVIINNEETLDLHPAKAPMEGYMYARGANDNVYIFDKERRYTWLYSTNTKETVEPVIQTHQLLPPIATRYNEIIPEFLINFFNDYPHHPDIRYLDGVPYLFLQNYGKVKGAWIQYIALVGYDEAKGQMEVYWVDKNYAQTNEIGGGRRNQSNLWQALIDNEVLNKKVNEADTTQIKNIFYHSYFETGSPTTSTVSAIASIQNDSNNIAVSIDGFSLKINTRDAGEVSLKPPSIFPISVPWFKNGRVGVDDGFVTIRLKNQRGKKGTFKAVIMQGTAFSRLEIIKLNRDDELIMVRLDSDAVCDKIEKAVSSGLSLIELDQADFSEDRFIVLTKNGFPIENNRINIGEGMIIPKVVDRRIEFSATDSREEPPIDIEIYSPVIISPPTLDAAVVEQNFHLETEKLEKLDGHWFVKQKRNNDYVITISIPEYTSHVLVVVDDEDNIYFVTSKQDKVGLYPVLAHKKEVVLAALRDRSKQLNINTGKFTGLFDINNRFSIDEEHPGSFNPATGEITIHTRTGIKTFWFYGKKRADDVRGVSEKEPGNKITLGIKAMMGAIESLNRLPGPIMLNAASGVITDTFTLSSGPQIRARLSAGIRINNFPTFKRQVLKSGEYQGEIIELSFGPKGTWHAYTLGKVGSATALIPVADGGAMEGNLIFNAKAGGGYVLTATPDTQLVKYFEASLPPVVRVMHNEDDSKITISIQNGGNSTAFIELYTYFSRQLPEFERLAFISNLNIPRKEVDGYPTEVSFEYDDMSFNSLDIVTLFLQHLKIRIEQALKLKSAHESSWIADKKITLSMDLNRIDGISDRKINVTAIERVKEGHKEFEITEVSVRGNSSVRLDLPVTVSPNQKLRTVVTHSAHWEEVVFSLTDKGGIRIETQTNIVLSEQHKVTVKHDESGEYKQLSFTVTKQINNETREITYSVGAPLAAPVPVGEVFYIPVTTNNYFARAAFQLNAQGKVEWLKDQTEFSLINITTTITLPAYDTVDAGVAELTWKREFNDDGTVKSHTFVSGKLRGRAATAQVNGDEITLTVDTDTYTEKLHLLVGVNDPTQSIVDESQSRFTQKAISRNDVLTTSLKNIAGANNELKVEIEEVKNGEDITRTIKSVWVRGEQKAWIPASAGMTEEGSRVTAGNELSVVRHSGGGRNPGSFLVQTDTETHWEDIEFKITEAGLLAIVKNDVWLNKPTTQQVDLASLHDAEGRVYPDIFEAQIDIVQNPRINPGQVTPVIPAGGIRLSFVGAPSLTALGINASPFISTNANPIVVGAGLPLPLVVELTHPQLGIMNVELMTDTNGNITQAKRVLGEGGQSPLPIEIYLDGNFLTPKGDSKLIIRFGNYTKKIGLFSYFGQGFKRGVQFQTGRFLINPQYITQDDLSLLMKLLGKPYFFSKGKPHEHVFLEVSINSHYSPEGDLIHTFESIRGLPKNNVLKETLLTVAVSTFPTPGIELGVLEARDIEKALDPAGATGAHSLEGVSVNRSQGIEMLSELNIHPAEWMKPTYRTLDAILDYLDSKQQSLPERLEYITNDGRVFSFAVKAREDRRTGFFDVVVDAEHPIETWVEGRKEASLQIIAQGPRIYNRGGRPLLFELKNEAGGDTQGKKAYELHMRPYRHSYTDKAGITHSLLPYFPYLINAMDHTGSNENIADIIDDANKKMAAYLYAYLTHKRGTPMPMPKVEYITQRTVKKDGEAISITFGNTSRTREKYEVYTLEGFQYYKEARYLKFAPRLKLKVQEFTPSGSLIRTTEHEIEHSPSRAIKGTILLQSVGETAVKFIWDPKRKTLMKVSDFNAAQGITVDQQKVLQDKINASRKNLYQQVEFRPGGGVRPVGVREAAFGDIEHMDRISILPPAVLSFEEPTGIQKLETPDAIQKLFDALAAKGIDLDAETLLPDEGSILAMSMVGRDTEDFTFLGENIILKIPFVEESTAASGDTTSSRYLADISTNPVEGLQGARILIKNPNAEGPEYFEIPLAALVSKRSGGVARENIEMDIPVSGDAKKHFTLVQFGNRASYTGRDVFGYQLRLGGAKELEGTPTTDLKAFQDQLPISRSPDYSSSILVNHGKNFQLKDSEGNVAFTLPLEMIELTHLGRPTYMMAGIVENTDGSFVIPAYEPGSELDEDGSPIKSGMTWRVYRLPQTERSVLYLQDEQNNWYTLMIGSRGEIWMWESNRDLREYQRPVKAFGFLNTGIRQAYKADKQAYATRVLSQGVATITAVLSQSADASRAAVTTGDKPRVSFEVRHYDAGWHAQLLDNANTASSEKWPFVASSAQIEIVEDSWLDPSGVRQFGKVRVIVKGEIKDASGTVVLRPYATLIFKNRQALLNQQSPLAIDYVHYHKSLAYQDSKLMTGDAGFVSERAGIPFDEAVSVNWDNIFLESEANLAVLGDLKNDLTQNTGHAAMAFLLGALEMISVEPTRSDPNESMWQMIQSADGSWIYNDAIIASLETYVRAQITSAPSGSSSGSGNKSSPQALSKKTAAAASVTPAKLASPVVQSRSVVANTPSSVANSKSAGGIIAVSSPVAEEIVAVDDSLLGADDIVGAPLMASSLNADTEERGAINGAPTEKSDSYAATTSVGYSSLDVMDLSAAAFLTPVATLAGPLAIMTSPSAVFH